MWFQVGDTRKSVGQKYFVRCIGEIAGAKIAEERQVRGIPEARKAAEVLASSFNLSATVYGTDADGEFVYGVHDVEESAEQSNDPLIKRLFAESSAASLSLKDQWLTQIPEDTIKGFAQLAASLGYLVAQHKAAKRTTAGQITYAALFRIFCGGEAPAILSLPANEATLALLSERLLKEPGWTCLKELKGTGGGERHVVYLRASPCKVTLNIDGVLQVLRPRTVFRGPLPKGGAQFMLVLQAGSGPQAYLRPGSGLDSLGLIYREADEAEVVSLVRDMLRDANPFKNRVVLLNRDLSTVRSRMSERSWADVIPHNRAKAELDFIAASIRDRESLRAEGLTIKRGLLLSGPPGDGKSTAIECFVNDIAGEATVIIVEAVSHIRYVYQLAQSLAPAVVILEDLDLMTKARQDLYASVSKDDVTGELLQVLSGGSAYSDIVTIATTNHPEAIDDALAKRAGRFDAHVRMGYPDEAMKQEVLMLYMDRYGVVDELTRRRLQAALTKELGRLQLVPAHIEEFVKAGVKRARLARRAPEYSDFEPGVEATKSIASTKAAG